MDNGGAVKTKEQTVMERESATLEETLRKFASVIETLETRLAPLVTPHEEPEAVKVEGEKDLSALAMRIRGWRRHIESLEIRISRLMSELEI